MRTCCEGITITIVRSTVVIVVGVAHIWAIIAAARWAIIISTACSHR